jgi:hypothetical protein
LVINYLNPISQHIFKYTHIISNIPLKCKRLKR